MLTCISSSFEDYLTKCETEIEVRARLLAGANYKWRIRDHFEKEYEGAFTTDENGYWSIPVSELPAGLLNHYNGRFLLEVLHAETCRPVHMLIAREYENIIFEIRGGTGEKNTIGCEVECIGAVGAASELIPFLAAAEVVIPWDAGRLAAFGNFPVVKVYHKVSGTQYTLVSASVERTTVNEVLTQLRVINGVAIDGYVEIS